MALVSANPEYSTAAQTLWPVLDFLRASAVDVGALLEPLGYGEEQLRESERRFSRSVASAIFGAVAARGAEPGTGFVVASYVTPATFDLLEYVARTSSTLREAFELVNRYAPLADDSASFSLEPLGEYVLWRLDMVWPPEVHDLVIEYLLGVLASIGARLSGAPVVPERIWLRRAAPADSERYERLFFAPVRFAAPSDGLVFSLSRLEQPVHSADPALAELLRQQAEARLAKLPRTDRVGDRVRRLIAEELANGEPTMQQIARRMATPQSTLRRHLSAEGTSFRDLLDQSRREAARTYLTDSQISLTEVAFRLGFQNASSFFKQFKRWTGETPAEYRRKNAQPG